MKRIVIGLCLVGVLGLRRAAVGREGAVVERALFDELAVALRRTHRW